MNILIPMAGLGSRFSLKGYDKPKPLIDVDGKTMIERSIETIDLRGQYIFVVRKYEFEKYNHILIQLLKNITNKPIIITVDHDTDGATSTCLLAKEHINNNEPLVITNCDQILKCSITKFTENALKNDVDGSIITYPSDDEKNSFAKVDNGVVTEVAEKKKISRSALVGVHYWKKGSDFVRSAEKLIEHKDKTKNEYYIAPTYNELIKEGKKISAYYVLEEDYISLGSPEELKTYIGKKNEYNIDKPKTILCDLDGTILKHSHSFSKVMSSDPVLLDGIKDKFDEWDSRGHKIIIMTGRKESVREKTENDLRNLGLCWDQLIMNVGNGTRILINDKLADRSPDRAISVNIKVDSGFKDVDWEKMGL